MPTQKWLSFIIKNRCSKLNNKKPSSAKIPLLGLPLNSHPRQSFRLTQDWLCARIFRFAAKVIRVIFSNLRRRQDFPGNKWQHTLYCDS
jgi:hypothetical protein